jgi:glucokinase
MMAGRDNSKKDGEPVVAALDLGGTKLAVAWLTKTGQVEEKQVVPLGRRDGPAVGRCIRREVSRLRRLARQRHKRIVALGICVPGIAYASSGRVWAPNIRGWEDYPLREELEKALADPAVPVVVDSDRAACIWGEVWRGAAQRCRNAIFMAVGTGIGAGILVDGRVLRGAHDSAGAIGWWALSQPFDPAYVACGDFESHASGAGLAQSAARLAASLPDYRGPLKRRRGLTAHEVFAAYATGDAVAAQVLYTAVAYWGAACANLVSLFNPEKIIFGGGIFGPATQFLRAIQGEAKKWAQPRAIQQVKFEASRLGGDAALYGAGYLAWRAGQPDV